MQVVIILMSGPPVKKVRQSSILESFPLQPKKITMASNDTTVQTSPLVDETIDLTADQVDEFLLDSQEDFKDEPKSVESDRNSSNHAKPTGSCCFGNPLNEINFGPSAWPILEPLRTTATHSVLFKPRSPSGKPPFPYPDSFKDIWDKNHVRMPCSNESFYPLCDEKGESLVNRWPLIESALKRPIQSSFDLEKSILSYNSRYAGKWNFNSLHALFNNVLSKSDADMFFKNTLPGMVEMALNLPNIVTHAVPLLKRQQNYSITMSQYQVACLLIHAFFCTYPRRNTVQRASEYGTYPSIHFNLLYSGPKSRINRIKIEKLKCLVHYFNRVIANPPTGNITFQRQCITDLPAWDKCDNVTFTKSHVTAKGTIEDDGHGMIQADFANKFLGGGVLNEGCVQEEIRFLICPELILTRLFTEVLDANECLIITGAERYSSYTGYADSFAWSGDYIDATIRDNWGRKQTQIFAIDALVFSDYASQFKPGVLRRELNKLYVAFSTNFTGASGNMAVATGNWGCGAFGGDCYLKALLQLMAAALSKRDVVYFTFGDEKLAKDISLIHQLLIEQDLDVSTLWSLLLRYHREIISQNKASRQTLQGVELYDFIFRLYTDCSEESQTLECSPDLV